MQQLSSGLQKWESTDTVKLQQHNDQWTTLDNMLRDYKKVVDTTTKDAALGVYKTVRYRRPDTDKLYLEATLSNPDANGYYQTDTWKYYAEDGTTVVKTRTWTLTYDTDGIVLTATPA